MTLDGTNTYVVRAPKASEAVIIDPGPGEPNHLDHVMQAATFDDTKVVAVVLTHAHADHAEGAPALAQRVGAPVLSVAAGTLAHGSVVEARGIDLVVHATPGHTADSVSLHLVQDDALFTGDTVLGRGTTYVDHPDGNLGDYLGSLDRLAHLVAERDLALLPGHAQPHPGTRALVEQYREHRLTRLAQVRGAVAEVGWDVEAVTDRVYGDQSSSVIPAARQSVAAQLVYLRDQGI